MPRSSAVWVTIAISILCACATNGGVPSQSGDTEADGGENFGGDPKGGEAGIAGSFSQEGAVGGSAGGPSGGIGGKVEGGASGHSVAGANGGQASEQNQNWVGVVACDRSPSFWPQGAKAAISLTYDDALPGQVRHGVPSLDAKGFKATFFLTTGGSRWNANLWKPLARSGHELASHSVTHNDKITRAAMEKEVIDSLAVIKSLGVKQPLFSFAYPNGALNGTDGPFGPLVLKHTIAARGLDGAATDRAAIINWSNVSSRILSTADNFDALVNGVIAKGSWLTFVTHGIQDDAYLNIPKSKHDELLDVLAAKGKDLWVAPFITVADYLQRCK